MYSYDNDVMTTDGPSKWSHNYVEVSLYASREHFLILGVWASCWFNCLDILFFLFHSKSSYYLPVSRVKQDQLTFPEHLSSPPIFSGIRVARSLVFCVMFCRSLLLLFLLTIISSNFRIVFSSHCRTVPILILFLGLCALRYCQTKYSFMGRYRSSIRNVARM